MEDCQNFSNIEFANAVNQPRIIVRNLFCGFFRGHWTSSLLVNRLIYIFDGSRPESRIGDERECAVMRRGHWLFVPAGHEVTHDQHPGLNLISIHFNVELYSHVEFMLGCRRLYQGDNPELLEDFRRFTNREGNFADVSRFHELVWHFLRPVVSGEGEALSRQAHNFARFIPLLEEIKRYPYRNFTIDEMAKVMKMGKESFVKHFKHETGMAPKEFFLQTRAALAARELLDSSLTIREIAQRFGCGNEFYFSRFIKKALGVSPKTYRKVMLQK